MYRFLYSLHWLIGQHRRKIAHGFSQVALFPTSDDALGSQAQALSSRRFWHGNQRLQGFKAEFVQSLR
ncbi:MAG: hypothetical protein HY870_08050 [Chloroflexi bacterium]|nr:hypothetical protein [Chloroflexota bacterium]